MDSDDYITDDSVKRKRAHEIGSFTKSKIG